MKIMRYYPAYRAHRALSKNRIASACILLVMAAFLSASLAQAADEAPKPVAIVNIKQILADAKSAKYVAEQVEKKRKEFQEKVSKEEDALRKEDEELAKQRSVLAAEAYEKKAAELKNKIADFQNRVQTRRSKLENGYTKALSEIQEAVLEITKDLAKEKGFIVALPKSLVLYAVDELEISDEILKRLDKKLPKVDVNFKE